MRAATLPVFAALMALAVPATAQDREVPYWASIRASELNMRVGPSADYKIAWVYHRAGLPCRVCGTAIVVEEAASRKLYWCPRCQA